MDHHEHHERDLYDLGLQADLAMMKRSPRERRRLIKLGLAGIGLLATGYAVASAQTETNSTEYLPLALAGATATPTGTVSPTATPTATATTTATVTTTPTATCVSEIPGETAGPYPADGSTASGQKLNVLTKSGIVRSDLRTSIGTGNTAIGIPLTVELALIDSSSNCVPLAGYAIYLWHCNRDGNYSMYSSGVTNEDYLRGVQATDSNGNLTFTTIFPGCYSGRWPHIHFEIYPSLTQATSAASVIHTSQLALPEDICKTVYATTGYAASQTNLSRITLATDNIFSDGYSKQMASLTGNTSSGYTARLTVGVDV